MRNQAQTTETSKFDYHKLTKRLRIKQHWLNLFMKLDWANLMSTYSQPGYPLTGNPSRHQL